jgi:hypothetical protein
LASVGSLGDARSSRILRGNIEVLMRLKAFAQDVTKIIVVVDEKYFVRVCHVLHSVLTIKNVR